MKYTCFYFLSMLLFACSSGEATNDKSILIKIGESDISDLFFSGKGGSYIIEIESDKEISFSANSNWCDISKISKTLTKISLEIKAQPNDLQSKREDVITINSVGDNKKINIYQDIKRPISNPGAMSRNSKQLAAEMFAGWNMGNSLEAYRNGSLDTETSWGNPKITKAMIDAVANAGFNAIRIPVRWYPHFIDTDKALVDEAWINRVKEVVGYCLNNDMFVIINTHHETWLESHAFYADSAEVYRKEYSLWTQIANAFKDYDERLLFAGTNEVHVDNEFGMPAKAEENTEVQNGMNQVFINAVRATGGNNSLRNLIVQTYCANSGWGVDMFVMPDDPTADRLMVEVHSYDPWSYAGLEEEKFWGTPYAAYNAGKIGQEKEMEDRFDKLKKKFVDLGYPVIVGECGAIRHSIAEGENAALIRESRAYYFQMLARTTKNYGAVPFIWDNGSIRNGSDQFGIFDRKNNMLLIDVQAFSAMMKGALSAKYPFLK